MIANKPSMEIMHFAYYSIAIENGLSIGNITNCNLRTDIARSKKPFENNYMYVFCMRLDASITKYEILKIKYK